MLNLMNIACFLCTIAFLFLNGCTTVVRVDIEKGNLIKEEPTGKVVTIEKIPILELLTKDSVAVYRNDKYGDEYMQYYEKVLNEVLVDLNPNYINNGIDYCAQLESSKEQRDRYEDVCFNRRSRKRISRNDFVQEIAFKNIAFKKNSVTSGSLPVSINNERVNNIEIKPDGTATLNIDNYFDILPLGATINITFDYGNKTVSSSIPYDTALKAALDRLPTYRKNASDKSVVDSLLAYKISNNDSDFNVAFNLSASFFDKNELEKACFNQARKLNSLTDYNKYKERYPYGQFILETNKAIDELEYNAAKESNKLNEFVMSHPKSSFVTAASKIIKDDERQQYVKNTCNGIVMSLFDFIQNGNIYADKGKCLSIIAVKFQITSSNTGLFNIGRDYLVYIEFPKAYRGISVRGLAQIKGEHSYITKMGTYNSVPHLVYLTDDDEDTR